MTQKEREAMCKEEFKEIEDIDLDYIGASDMQIEDDFADENNFDKISDEEKEKMKDDIIITDEEISDFMSDLDNIA